MLAVQPSPSSLPFHLLPAAQDLHTSIQPKAQDIKSHVTVEDLKAHLLLLTVFNKIHHTVQRGGVTVDDFNGLPTVTSAQFLFFARAQHRFDLWVSRILRRRGRNTATPLQFNEIPPADVLMLLHAYMLNPWDFYEDCCNSYPEFKAFGPFPLTIIKGLVDVDKMEIIPSTEQTRLWEVLTGTPFAIPLNTDTSMTVKVKCPSCICNLTVPWINSEETGFGQIGFLATCTHCATVLTRESLCVARFLEDLVPANGVLAHTLLSNVGEMDTAFARLVAQMIRKALGNPKASDGGKFDWKLVKIFEILKSKSGAGGELERRLDYIMKAYSHPNGTSLNLGEAALRQCRFIQEMHRLGWCGHMSFEGEDTSLLDAIVRYHQFLALNSKSMVPSIDIDLAFHTNILQGATFREMSFRVLGRLIGHDDSLVRDVIVQNFGNSKKVWEGTYGSEYAPKAVDACANSCGSG